MALMKSLVWDYKKPEVDVIKMTMEQTVLLFKVYGGKSEYLVDGAP